MTVYLLWTQIGLASIVAISLSVALIPLNYYLSQKLVHAIKRQQQARDRRLGKTTDLVTHIRMVKMLSLEDFFLDAIRRWRGIEVAHLATQKYIDAVFVFIWASTAVVLSVSTFSVYSALGHTLSAPVVFTTLTLLNMLIFPLNSFPWVVNGLLEAYVSVGRIERFLNEEFYRNPALVEGRSKDEEGGTAMKTNTKADGSAADMFLPSHVLVEDAPAVKAPSSFSSFSSPSAMGGDDEYDDEEDDEHDGVKTTTWVKRTDAGAGTDSDDDQPLVCFKNCSFAYEGRMEPAQESTHAAKTATASALSSASASSTTASKTATTAAKLSSRARLAAASSSASDRAHTQGARTGGAGLPSSSAPLLPPPPLLSQPRKATLSNVSLSVSRGEIIHVCGPVGVRPVRPRSSHSPSASHS